MSVRKLHQFYNGLSPNGKATDSDSVIFQVRILVALLQTPKENSSGVFVITAQKGCRVAEPSDSCYNNCKASAALEDLKQKEANGNVQKKDARKQAFFYRDEIVPAMEALRAPVDALEMKVDRSFWPMPGYADLLFEV